jgi:alpha-soluble NSF attachment protein
MVCLASSLLFSIVLSSTYEKMSDSTESKEHPHKSISRAAVETLRRQDVTPSREALDTDSKVQTSIDQGVQFMKQAEMKRKGGFMSFISGGPDYFEAAELFKKAGHQFKLAKEYEKAADAYIQCGICSGQSAFSSEEANSYLEAAKCLKQVSIGMAIEWFEKAVALYTMEGNFGKGGKIYKEIAETLDAPISAFVDGKEAILSASYYYVKAVELFSVDDRWATSITACNSKRAELLSLGSEFIEAAKLFEEEADKDLNKAIKFRAKEHLLKSGFCLLASGDIVRAKFSLKRFESKDPWFIGSKEGNLLKALIESFENQDLTSFQETLREYDNVSKLDH